MTQLGLAVLAGAFIALGAMFATTVLVGVNVVVPYGIGRLLAGVAFCLCLILVVVGGAELFTGNTLMVMASASGKVKLRKMLRAWAIIYVGNLFGAVGTALLVFLSDQPLNTNGAIAAVAMQLAAHKTNLPFDLAFFLGILCNVLVCLDVWHSIGVRNTSDKVLAVLFPVSAVVVAGFEHAVANMYLIPLGLFLKAWAPVSLWMKIGSPSSEFAALTWTAFIGSLIPVTLGNIVG